MWDQSNQDRIWRVKLGNMQVMVCIVGSATMPPRKSNRPLSQQPAMLPVLDAKNVNECRRFFPQEGPRGLKTLVGYSTRHVDSACPNTATTTSWLIYPLHTYFGCHDADKGLSGVGEEGMYRPSITQSRAPARLNMSIPFECVRLN